MTKSDPEILSSLFAEFGQDSVLTSEVDRFLYSTDASKQRGDCLAVVRPRTESEVVRLLELALQHEFAVVPRGSGTSPTGSARPARGQVLLDLSRMNRIVAIDGGDQVAVVEPGVLVGDLHAATEAKGLFYPPDPASSRFSTIGGNVATCAGGLRAVKYGVTRDYVLGLRAVLMGGKVLEIGGRALKDVVGYDLTRLLVGSEGTLAVITEIVLRLIPLPPEKSTILASFEDEAGGFRGADAVLAAQVLPRAMEYMDRDVLEIIALHLKEPAPEGVSSRLLIEIDGARAQVQEDEERTLEALRRAGATEVRPARDAAERDRLWQGRRAISPAVFRVTPAKKSEDLGVPRSQLAEAVAAIKAKARAEGIRALAYGHAGDANLHCNFLYDPAIPGQKEALQRAVDAAFGEVLARGGTISGEHGVGLAKKSKLTLALRPEALNLMRGIKNLFDPKNLLNPGKALPDWETDR